jgi:hypothetical protein
MFSRILNLRINDFFPQNFIFEVEVVDSNQNIQEKGTFQPLKKEIVKIFRSLRIRENM